ncbi:DUF4185 domain-containing protein [Rhodococcus marinonascens]|uniref:DUF4185 domain-containing protein n=1 Tax=Rhodococcus marinonascens TaxID=38311 RepID=UPI000934BD94|nr:DUF4185 domain-containing protein [Rhodococcus marinonascens]
MTRLVKTLTYDETARFGFRATDLGFTAQTNHGYCITIFGDTFNDTPDPAPDQDWRSPVGLRQSNADIENGIIWDNAISGARAEQMLPYRHFRGDGITQIPNDLIHLPDGRYMLTTFGVRDWANASRGGSWTTWNSRMWTSTDAHGENWVRSWDVEANHVNFDFPNGWEWSHFQNNSMIMFPGEPWVYFYGTNEGRWNGGGIHLMRVNWTSMWHRSTYEFWGADASGTWAWRRGGNTTPILIPTLPNNAIGELCAQVIDGRVVLAYIDGILGAVTRTSPRPEGLWTGPKVQVTGIAAPALYAAAIHPFSHLGRAQMLLSQWPQNPLNPAAPTIWYGVKQWEVSLEGSLMFTKNARMLEDTGNVPDGIVTPECYRGYLTPQLQNLERKELAEVLIDLADDDVDPDCINQAVTTDEIEDTRTSPASTNNFGEK